MKIKNIYYNHNLNKKKNYHVGDEKFETKENLVKILIQIQSIEREV